jgi:hypothetical protein
LIPNDGPPRYLHKKETDTDCIPARGQCVKFRYRCRDDRGLSQKCRSQQGHAGDHDQGHGENCEEAVAGKLALVMGVEKQARRPQAHDKQIRPCKMRAGRGVDELIQGDDDEDGPEEEYRRGKRCIGYRCEIQPEYRDSGTARNCMRMGLGSRQGLH